MKEIRGVNDLLKWLIRINLIKKAAPVESSLFIIHFPFRQKVCFRVWLPVQQRVQP